MLAMSASPVLAQTRDDSISIAKLIATRALRDAKRQAPDIAALSFAPNSRPSKNYRSKAGADLLEYGISGELIREVGSPICPWFKGGLPDPRLEVAVNHLRISGNQATADVMLICSPVLYCLVQFACTFAYTFNRSGGKWRLTKAEEVAIT